MREKEMREKEENEEGRRKMRVEEELVEIGRTERRRMKEEGER